MTSYLCAGLTLIAVALADLSGCAINPVTGSQQLSFTSTQEEIRLGSQQYPYAQQAEGGPYLLDPALNAYVNRVGQKLAAVSDAPTLPWEFVVLNNSTPNAWALPGGKLAINRGLLLALKDEAELAAVLGHEITHAAARHGAQAQDRGMLANVGLNVLAIALGGSEWRNLAVQGAQLGAGAVMQTYSRGHELEADRYGIKYMVAAGYDPEAAVDLQQTFVKLSGDRRSGFVEGLFASHPPSQARVDANREIVRGLPGGTRNAAAYQRAIAGLKRDQAAYEAYDKGVEAYRKKDFPRARQLAEDAIARQPREGLFHELKGLSLIQQKQSREALTALNKAVDANDRYFRFLLHRGLIKRELGDTGGARQDLEASYRLLPSATTKRALGDLAAASGDREQAVAAYREAARSDSADGRAARATLTRMDMAEHPERYLQVFLDYDRHGRVMVALANPTDALMANVHVRIIPRSTGLQGDQVLFGGFLDGGRRTPWQPTGIRLSHPGQLERLQAVVTRAQVVRR